MQFFICGSMFNVSLLSFHCKIILNISTIHALLLYVIRVRLFGKLCTFRLMTFGNVLCCNCLIVIVLLVHCFDFLLQNNR